MLGKVNFRMLFHSTIENMHEHNNLKDPLLTNIIYDFQIKEN